LNVAFTASMFKPLMFSVLCFTSSNLKAYICHNYFYVFRSYRLVNEPKS
jgi:hypothetical protein